MLGRFPALRVGARLAVTADRVRPLEQKAGVLIDATLVAGVQAREAESKGDRGLGDATAVADDELPLKSTFGGVDLDERR